MLQKNKLYKIISWSRLICLVSLITFCILKWTNVINWSWVIVLIPLYLFVTIFVIGFVIVYLDVRRQD